MQFSACGNNQEVLKTKKTVLEIWSGFYSVKSVLIEEQSMLERICERGEF